MDSTHHCEEDRGSKLLLAAAFTVLLSLSACSSAFPCAHRLRISEPALPAAWEVWAPEEWLLEWTDTRGGRVRVTLPRGFSAEILVRRGECQAILAFPVILGYRLRPAGLLYPYELAQPKPSLSQAAAVSHAELRWESGYAAMVAERLADSGANPWAFNLGRLESAWASRGADPWALPIERCAEALARRRFRASLFAVSAVECALPEGGPWLPESPMCRIDRLSDPQRIALPAGMTKLISEGYVLLFSVNDGKVVSLRSSR